MRVPLDSRKEKENLRIVILMMIATLVSTATDTCSDVLGRIVFAAEPGGTSCNLVDVVPGPVYAHLLITEAARVNAVQFAAPKPACWVGATWIGDSIVFPVHTGDSQNLSDPHGLMIGLPSCMTSPVYLGAIVFWTQGQAPPCCVYPIVKANDWEPGIPTPIMLACDGQEHGITPGYAVVNPDPSCSCGGPVAAEPKTWGALKALYR